MYQEHSNYNTDIKLYPIFKSMVIYVFEALLFTALALICFAFIFGYRPLTVITGSMSPTIMPNNDIIVVHFVEPADLVVGDIVTYRLGNDSFCTHRIIEIGDQWIRTKGDANKDADTYMTPFDKIYGRVDIIYKDVGSVYVFIKANLFMILTALLCVIQLSSMYESELLYRKNLNFE